MLLSPITMPIVIIIAFGKVISLKITDMSVNSEYFWERMERKMDNVLDKVK